MQTRRGSAGHPQGALAAPGPDPDDVAEPRSDQHLEAGSLIASPRNRRARERYSPEPEPKRRRLRAPRAAAAAQLPASPPGVGAQDMPFGNAAPKPPPQAAGAANPGQKVVAVKKMFLALQIPFPPALVNSVDGPVPSNVTPADGAEDDADGDGDEALAEEPDAVLLRPTLSSTYVAAIFCVSYYS